MIAMIANIVDVSEWNGIIDWQAVKDAGYHAIIRCGYGSDYENQDDKQWHRNVSECERLGIPYGVYLYSYATNEDMARSEAEHVLRLIEGHSPSYPIYFDTEENGTQTCSKACAIAFGDVIEKAGYWCGVYASEYWWEMHLEGLNRFTKWVAKWSSFAPDIEDYDVWQYSSDGEVPGIEGRCDVNRCYRDFIAEIGREVVEPLKSTGIAFALPDDLADRVIANEFGCGDERKLKLRDRYEVVQAIVNYRYGITFTLDAIADSVIDGRYGNGDERKRNLGSIYDAVQEIVNKKVLG